MQKIEIEAIYEDGILKLPHELPLIHGQRVTITIETTDLPHHRRGLIEWKGSVADLDYLILSDENDPMEAS